MDVKERAQIIFNDIFCNGARKLELSNEMTVEDIESWSSLKHFKLIAAIEREFNIKFTTAEIKKINTIGDFITAVKSKTS